MHTCACVQHVGRGVCFASNVCVCVGVDMVHAEASEGSEQTKHWRGKPLFTNNRLPLQCFVSSEASDAPGYMALRDTQVRNVILTMTCTQYVASYRTIAKCQYLQL